MEARAGAAGVAALASGVVAEPKRFSPSVSDRPLPESQRLVRVSPGDDVVLEWTADRG